MTRILELHIRPAVLADMANISALMQESALEFIAHELATPAVDQLLKSLSEECVLASCQDGILYWVAEYHELLVGVLGTKSSNHLLHCFVNKRFHRRGIARAMWEFVRSEVLKDERIEHFTVHSSLFAVPFYEALGFVTVSGVTVVKGVKFVPMSIECDSSFGG